MQKKLLVSLLVSLALSVPAGYAVYLLTDSDFLSPGILRLMQALAVLLLVGASIGVHPDKIMIGNIMLVIPGIQLTTSLRDMINGDTISGLLNLSEAILKAISVALGFALVLLAGGV